MKMLFNQLPQQTHFAFLEKYLAYSGLLASIWIVFGLLIAASKYKGYSHAKQLCSELCASGLSVVVAQ